MMFINILISIWIFIGLIIFAYVQYDEIREKKKDKEYYEYLNFKEKIMLFIFIVALSPILLAYIIYYEIENFIKRKGDNK